MAVAGHLITAKQRPPGFLVGNSVSGTQRIAEGPENSTRPILVPSRLIAAQTRIEVEIGFWPPRRPPGQGNVSLDDPQLHGPDVHHKFREYTSTSVVNDEGLGLTTRAMRPRHARHALDLERRPNSPPTSPVGSSPLPSREIIEKSTSQDKPPRRTTRYAHVWRRNRCFRRVSVPDRDR